MFDLQNFDLGEEIKNSSSISGEQRAGHLKFMRSYARAKSGDTGIRAIDNELLRHGFKLPDIMKLRDLEWISSVLPTVYMLAMVKAFHWNEKDVYEMGRDVFSFSHPLRFFLKYFVSTEKTFKIAAEKWQNSFSYGRMEIINLDKKEKTVIVRLVNFRKHPVTCIYLRGVFAKIVEMATGSGKATAEETKCVFRGDQFHEYRIGWE